MEKERQTRTERQNSRETDGDTQRHTSIHDMCTDRQTERQTDKLRETENLNLKTLIFNDSSIRSNLDLSNSQSLLYYKNK